MPSAKLSAKELNTIKNHVDAHPITVAVMRTGIAPTEMTPLLNVIARACRLELKRISWSPSSDFGFAELYSKEKMLVVLWVGGKTTELMSVSPTDEAFVQELEESIHSSKFYSDLVRHGT